MAFVGLHNHSHYSNFRLRDSTNKIKDMIDYSHELGHCGIAITEHETIASSLEAIKYVSEKKKESGWESFKLILGNEIYLCPDTVTEEKKVGAKFPHFILLALNANGHKAIRELSTKAWSQSFMHVMMRVPTYYDDLFELLEKYKGDIVGSSGCLGGALPSRLLAFRHVEDTNLLEYNAVWHSCKDWINTMNDAFGRGYFYLELQPSHTEEQVYINKKLLQLSRETSTPYIITTDAHYLKKEEAEVHKIFLNSQEGDREIDAFYQTTYIMTEQEIHEYMDQYIGHDAVEIGFANTVHIHSMVQEFDLRKELHIPYVPMNTAEPDKALYEKYKDKVELFEFCYTSPYPSDRHLLRDLLTVMDKDEYLLTPEAFKSIQECLAAVKDSSTVMKVRWSAYLLQIADYVKLMWDNEITVGAGRGSGVGFILNYMLGITQINPLRETTKTYFWRFLNPDRTASILDLDLDISSDKSDFAVEVLKKHYGEDRISKVMTIGTEKSKSAILTTCRGLGTDVIDNDTAQYIASLIVSDRGAQRTLQQMYYGDDDCNPVYEFVKIVNEYPKVWEVAQKIEGLINSVGSHAGGIILVDEPFTESTALMKTNSGDVITQFDLHMCESVSLIKVDLLKIDAISKMDAGLKLLLRYGEIEWQGTWKATYDKYLGIYTLERDNQDMWKMLWDHKVLAFFQMEKESGKQAISLARPTSVDDLATINSVMRLMAQEKGGESPLVKYARFKHEIAEWYNEMSSYGLTEEEQEILKSILITSCGICEAQEYLVLLTNHPKIGGLSLGWGDFLRKAVAKKKPKEFLKLQDEYFTNAETKNLSKNLVTYVWNVLIATQRGYGLNLLEPLYGNI